MENSFRLESFNQLPVELQFIILDFVGPCWYLIVLGETRRLVEQLRNAHESQPEQLSLARDIYISRTTYQGNSYISRMSNTPLESRLLDIPNQQHLKLPDHIRKVILSKDHVGLRRVQFVDQNSDPSPDESPWYEVLEVTDLHVEVNVSFDVSLFILVHGQQLKVARACLSAAFGSPQMSLTIHLGPGVLHTHQESSRGTFIASGLAAG